MPIACDKLGGRGARNAMLIPTGVVESEVRRTPWISIGLLVLLVAVFASGVRGGVSARRMHQVRQELERTVKYWLEHPWLRAPEGLAGTIGGSLYARLSEEVEAGRSRAERNGAIPVAVVVAKQQGDLDALFDGVARLLKERGDLGLSYVPSRPALKTLVAHMFLHGDFWHLFWNALFLFVTAPFLEDVYGRALFAALYLLGGAFAAGCHGLFTLHPDAPLLGASGALAAVMGAFLVRLGRSHIRFLFVPVLFLPMFRFHFALPAFVVLPFWFGEQVLAARLVPEAPVAWWAHIGGFAFGMAVALGLKLFRVEERWIDPAIEGRIGWSQDPGLLKASDARAAGAFATARNSARAVLAKDPGNVDAWRSLLDTELASGRKAEAAAAATRLLERYAATREADLAIALVGEARETLSDVLPSRFFLAAASSLERAGDSHGAWAELEALVARSPGDPASVRAALKMADLARRDGSDGEALDLLAWARSHPACETGFREAASRAEEEILHRAPALASSGRSLPARRFASYGEARTLPAHLPA